MGFHTVVMPLLKYAKDICHKRNINYSTHFTTNASLLTDKMISEFKESNIPIGFQITLDGNRKSHDSIRCTKTGQPTFDTIVANIHKLLQNGFKVSLRINYTTANLDTNYDIIDEFKDLSDDEKKLLRVNFQQIWQDSKPKSQDKSVNQIKKQFTKNKLCDNSILTNNYRCYADCENKVVINYNGDVYKCTARDFLSENREGLLRENGHVTFNEKYKKRMKIKHSNQTCSACNIYPICMGMCSQYLLENDETPTCPYGRNESAKKEIYRRVY